MSQRTITVGDLVCPPGELRKGKILVGYERDSSELCLSALVANGSEPGPTVYIGGIIHGGELAGCEVIRRVMREAIDPRRLKGALIAIPIQNPLAYRTSTYHSLEDGLNANRIFPGDPTETLTNRAVAAITREAVSQSDYVLDLHCNARDSVLFNFVRWGDGPVYRQNVALSKAFGFTTVLSQAKRQGFGFEERLMGLLADMACDQGKPNLTVELTPQYNWEEPALEAGVRGVLNVLKHLQMISGDIERHQGVLIIDKVLGPQLRVTANRGGLVHPAEPVGTYVHKDQIVVRIRDPWGDVVEEIRAPADGHVLAYPRHGNHAAASGDIVVFVAPESHAAD